MGAASKIETFTLTLIGNDGLQIAIGEDGAPVFEVFYQWAKAREAIRALLDDVALEYVHSIACTKVELRDGTVAHTSTTHFTQDEVLEMANGTSTLRPGHLVTLANGRRVNVSVPA